MSTIRQRIERGGERLWQSDDFREFSFMAVAQALSRLKREGEIERLSKGVYYRTRATAFGRSRPNPAAVRNLVAKHKTVYPAGLSAANLLGFTTQLPEHGEIATSGLSLPRKLFGSDTVIHTRRPEAWAGLSNEDAALLDFLRRGGRTSELSPQETTRRTLKLFAQPGRYEHLIKSRAIRTPTGSRVTGRDRGTARQECRTNSAP